MDINDLRFFLASVTIGCAVLALIGLGWLWFTRKR